MKVLWMDRGTDGLTKAIPLSAPRQEIDKTCICSASVTRCLHDQIPVQNQYNKCKQLKKLRM